MRTVLALLFSCVVCFGQLPVIPLVTSSANIANTDLSKLTNLTFWYRADKQTFSDTTFTIPTANKNALGSWSDQSGNGYGMHAFSGTNANCIWLSTGGGSNNLPCVEFNGSSTVVNMATSMGNNASNQPVNIWFVAAWTNTASTGATLCDTEVSGRAQVEFRTVASGGSFMFAGTVFTWSDAYIHTNWTLFRFVFSGASSQVYTNGVLMSSGSAGTQQLGGFVVGDAINSSAPFPGLVAEIVGISGFTPSATVINTINSALDAKYALY